MTRMLRLAFVLVALSFAPACSTVPVSEDYDPEFDFTTLGSYAWLERKPDPESGSLTDNSLVIQRVRRAVDEKMTAKGYRRTEPSRASFLVTHHISVDQKLRVDTTSYGYGWGYWGYGSGMYSDTTVRQYEVGTLIIDFIDPKKMELRWRGTGESRLRDRQTPEQREAQIKKVVDAILDQFPPTVKR